MNSKPARSERTNRPPWGTRHAGIRIAGIACVVVVCAVAALTLVPAAANAATQPLSNAEPQYWIENAELIAIRQPVADHGAEPPAAASGSGTPSAASGAGTQAPAHADHAAGGATRAEVFDSADYQYLLLVGPSWPEALLLELGTGDVRAYPGAEILGPEGRPRRIDPAAGRTLTGFTTHADGRITFATADHDYAVEPAAPLVGDVPASVLFARHPVYERQMRAYSPDPAAVAELAGIARDVEIVAFFGTWCQICKKHLPALLSALERAGNAHLRVTLIAVSEDGAEPADWIAACEAGYSTPTFIVRVDEMEIGRIEEEPRGSVEGDLADILAQLNER